MPPATTASPNQNTSPQSDSTSDWTGADFDSYQNLAASGTQNPAGTVTAARAPRRTA